MAKLQKLAEKWRKKWKTHREYPSIKKWNRMVQNFKHDSFEQGIIQLEYWNRS
jgi:hypothetical protein